MQAGQDLLPLPAHKRYNGKGRMVALVIVSGSDKPGYRIALVSFIVSQWSQDSGTETECELIQRILQRPGKSGRIET